MTDRLVPPRKRLVNFRVTEDEYLRLREACLAHGSRGMSDYARWATLESVRWHDGPGQAGVPQELVIQWLDERFTSFEWSIRRLLDAINSVGDEVAGYEKDGDVSPV